LGNFGTACAESYVYSRSEFKANRVVQPGAHAEVTNFVIPGRANCQNAFSPKKTKPMTPSQMNAVVIVQPGGPEVLQVRQVPRPVPQGSEVLIRVRAAALNRADLLQRRGLYPAPAGVPSDIPGLEFAGDVEAAGSGVQLWKPGDRVMGLTAGGAQAQYLVAHERTLAEIPTNFSYEQAAAIPEAFITAHDALWKQAVLRPGERVLIHAVASGVGLAAVQLTRALNATPLGTSRTAEKLERARQFGLESGFVVPGSLTVEEGKHWAESGTFDVVADLIGGAYVNASIQALASRGRIILIGTLGGNKCDIDIGLLMGKRAAMLGTMLRARPLEEKITVTRTFAAEVVPLFQKGTLQPVIDSTFAMRDIRLAHQRMESNASFGKIVLLID
jgi:putative PIG3 family NAD(P)H quinone oxidoreductase